MADPLDRLTNALEGRYRVERELGAGGMATVYVAEDLRHHRKVAIKVLRQDLAASLGAERFLREIEIAARLSHPHILPLYDSGGVGNVLFYVMPLVDGESLRDRITRSSGGLPVEDAVRVMREVADALAHAHRHGVVHRDIKPENILLSGSHALVTDFGIAKAVSDSTAGSTLTGTGVSLGTAAYMAPEQVTADPAIDHRADIYALGATAFEMLAGQPPFSGNAQQIMSGHLTRRPESLSVLRSTVPPALESLVLKCLEKNPSDRPQSADEIVRSLEALHATSAHAAAPDAAPAPRVPARRRTVPLLAGVAAVLVLTVAGIAWFARVGRAGTLIGDDVLAENDVVLVSEFENRTADSTLAATITDAIRVELQQSRAVRAMTQAAMWAGLARMGLEHGTALPQPRVRELAEREGAKAFVVGEVARLGGGYQITARVVATADGAEALTAKATARSEADLIGAVESVARELRRGIGESLRSVMATPPLAEVTTSSLPALRALTAGQRLHNEARFAEAVRLADQALSHDSAFASAYSLKYAAHSNLGESSKAAEAARQAYRLRERLTEVERLRIEARYAASMDDRAAEEAAWMRLAELGRDETNYAAMLMGLGRFEEAERMARRAIVSQPTSTIAHWNLAEILVAQHKFTAADSTSALVRTRFPTNPYRYFVPLGVAWGRRDFDAFEAWLAGDEGSKTPDVDAWKCLMDLQRGRIRAWQRCPSRNSLVFENAMVQLAEFRITGDTSRARVGYASFLASPPDARSPDRYAWTIALLAEVGKVQDARKLLQEWRTRTGRDDPGFRGDSSLAVGAIAAAEQRWDEAIEAFRDWNRSPPAAAMTLYNRGLPEQAAIFARRGQADSAIVLFERAIGTSSAFGGGFYEPGWYAPALLALGELYEARGDRAKAAEYYGRHIAVFKDPDESIARQVAAVREKLARVTGEQGTLRR